MLKLNGKGNPMMITSSNMMEIANTIKEGNKNKSETLQHIAQFLSNPDHIELRSRPEAEDILRKIEKYFTTK